ncbi:hypothetical protein DVH05_003827 [Phytophthora capsici]|nr:hypothetical protein DVH05_003827 [Phytophthora capsici]
MVRQSHDKNDYVTYTIVTSPATEHAPADTAKINIPKFYGGNAKDWLRWSMRFKSLAQQKGWNVEQAALQLLLLLDGEMKNDVEDAARQATQEGFSFSQFYENIGQQLVPLDYSETLDEELWNLTKRSNESVQQVYRRLKELVRMFAELPVNAESIPEVQQCRFLKRAMPHAWQDKLAASGIVHERMSELLQYFERLEMREKSIAKDKSNNQQQKPPRYSQPSKSTHLERHKSGNDKNKHGNSAASAQKGQSKWCSHHQTSSHNTKDCFALKKQQSAEHKQAETKKPSKSKKYPKVYKADSESSDEDEEFKFISLVNKKPSTTKAPLRIDVQLRGEHSTIEALLDSGASKSVINAAAMEAIAKHGRRQVASNTTFQTAGGPVKSDGSAIA